MVTGTARRAAKGALAMAVMASFAAGCAPFRESAIEPLKPVSMELVKRFKGRLEDDMSLRSLEKAAAESVTYLQKIDPGTVIRYGEKSVTPDRVARSVKRLVEIFRDESDHASRAGKILREFDVYRGTGVVDGGGNVLVTGYYQPLLNGSRVKDNSHRWPIYRKPDDLVNVDLGLFFKTLRGKRISGMVRNGAMVPYYDRRSIDRDGAIADKGLEVVWVDDPVDLFILHVQGSGVVRFGDGSTVNVNYATSNGRKYRSIGKLLIDKGAIPREKMSLSAIRSWFKEHPDQVQEVMDHNPSYVFFRLMDDGPFGSTGAKLEPGRSVALDPRLFPKGSIVYFTVDLPVVENGVITRWKKTGRFAFFHDQGGAIKGAGRMDLFFGLGSAAEISAGAMKHPGDLYFLVLKQ